MRKFTIIILLLMLLTSILSAKPEWDFCGQTILVLLEPSMSSFTGTPDKSFF